MTTMKRIKGRLGIHLHAVKLSCSSLSCSHIMCSVKSYLPEIPPHHHFLDRQKHCWHIAQAIFLRVMIDSYKFYTDSDRSACKASRHGGYIITFPIELLLSQLLLSYCFLVLLLSSHGCSLGLWLQIALNMWSGRGCAVWITNKNCSPVRYLVKTLSLIFFSFYDCTRLEPGGLFDFINGSLQQLVSRSKCEHRCISALFVCICTLM